jgi:glycerol uptake facilitator-like aquaporin
MNGNLTPVKTRSLPNGLNDVHHLHIDEQAFAGRIGGNQRSAINPKDAHYLDRDDQSTPDATPGASWTLLLNPRGFLDIRLWKKAFIEGLGTCLLVYIMGLVTTGIVPLVPKSTFGPAPIVAVAALIITLLVALFIFVLGPVTGAHHNPLITMTTFSLRLASLPRATLYIIFQCLGSIIGAYLLRFAIGGDSKVLHMSPGCYINPSEISQAQAFVLETTSSLFVIFMAFGLGLDPRNANAFPPALAPFLVGSAVGLALFSGGISVEGYLGSSNNPARCLGLMMAGNRFTYHWIHWIADLTAVL